MVTWRFAALLAAVMIALLVAIIVIEHLANQNHFTG
jgi:hypothetical protein